jgi:WD40 repeat protein
MKEPNEWNEVMVYSPDSEWLAVGSHDDKVYIYSAKDYSLKGVISGPSSAILAIDWTLDNNTIRLLSQAYEKLYANISDCKVDPHGQDNFGVKPNLWASNTCKISPLNSGVYR